jgi:hypothetical protein
MEREAVRITTANGQEAPSEVTYRGMARRKISNDLWTALESLLPSFVVTKKWTALVGR